MISDEDATAERKKLPTNIKDTKTFAPVTGAYQNPEVSSLSCLRKTLCCKLGYNLDFVPRFPPIRNDKNKLCVYVFFFCCYSVVFYLFVLCRYISLFLLLL